MIEASEKGFSPKPWLVFWVFDEKQAVHEKTALKLKL
jgi:hypothetical protein